MQIQNFSVTFIPSTLVSIQYSNLFKLINEIEKLSWEPTKHLAKTGSSLTRRFRHTCVSLDNKIFAFGGSGSGVLLNDMHLLELEDKGGDADTDSASAGTATTIPSQFDFLFFFLFRKHGNGGYQRAS